MKHLFTVLALIVAFGFMVVIEAQALTPNALNDRLQQRVAGTANSDALTIATWNLQFLPIVGSTCCDHISNRLNKIADGVLAANIDVIAFNEVFTDEAKDKLDALLADEYPYRVTSIDGDGVKKGLHTAEEAREIMRTGVIGNGKQGLIDKQDSGLMLFSKYPFQAFPRSGVELVPTKYLKAIANGKRWPHVTFDQFGVCEGFILPSSGQSTDCMANKGVAFVRVVKPGIDAENIYNIGFTHFEAGTDDPELGPLIRDLAIDAPPTSYVESLFERAIGDRPNEHTIVLGDLNINGAATANRAEWVAKFTQPGRFFSGIFKDSWEDMRPRSVGIDSFDPGLSNRVFDETQSRLDYILVKKNSMQRWNNKAPCVLHVRVPPLLYLSDAGEELSDHRPVVSTLNRPSKHCSPQTGKTIKRSMFESGPLLIKGKETQVSYPEGAQWYVLPSAGTYSIAGWSRKGAVSVEVYSSENMSVPMTAYHGETRDIDFAADAKNSAGVKQTASVFVSPDKPLLIKVTMPNGNTGAYSLGINKHAGESRDDAIVLFPGIVEHASLSHNVATSLKRWFRIDTDGPVSDEAQSLQFSVIPSQKVRVVSELVKADGTVVMRSNDKAFARRNADDNFQTYYLATSAERSGKKAELKVVWKTNLHMLVMQQHTGDTSVLTAINETGWDVLGSDDNVQMKLFADGVPGHDRTATFGSFDSGTVAQVDPEIKCSIGFLDTLKVEISEDEWVRKDQVLTGDIDGALLLTPNEPYRGAQHVMLTSGAGEYRLKFYLMRGTQWVSRYGYAPAFNSRERVRSKCRER